MNPMQFQILSVLFVLFAVFTNAQSMSVVQVCTYHLLTSLISDLGSIVNSLTSDGAYFA